MRYYLAFDDTDIKDSPIGTGRFAREFVPTLEKGWQMYGIIRQQYPQSKKIPFTSNNSSATIIFDHLKDNREDYLIEKASQYIKRCFVEGSDPGLCIAAETKKNESIFKKLLEFGLRCTSEVVTKQDAQEAAKGIHLSEHGGTGDGIIGATAGVGLAAYGWSGRFVEMGSCDLRSLGQNPTVLQLEKVGIKTVCVSRFDLPLRESDIIGAWGWIRPRLWAKEAILPVTPAGRGYYTPTNLSIKRSLKID